MPIKTILADDHKLFRLGLKGIIENFEGIEVIGEASNGKELLEILQKKTVPDIVLLDLNMPDLNGFEALDIITKKFKSIKPLIISMYDGDNYISQAIELGACGYVHKNSDPEEIEVAIKTTYEQGFYFNEKTNKAMLHRLVRRNKLKPVFDDRNISLNDRELGVLKYLSQELTSSEIADKMFLSKRTIEGIRQQLILKTNSKNVVGLILFAAKTGLIDL